MLVKAGEFQGRFLCVKNMPRMLDLFLVDSRLGNGEVWGGHFGQTGAQNCSLIVN